MITEPGPGASGVPRGATHRAEDQFHSGPVHGAISLHADLYYSPAAGSGGGSRLGGRGPPRGEDPVPEMEVEVERSPVPDSSPTSPPPSALAPANTAGPSLTLQQSLEHFHVSSRELAAVMDTVCALATTQASLD